MNKICKFFVNGNCKDNDQCRFKHEEGICKEYFFKECTRNNCRFKHTAKLENKSSKPDNLFRRKKNTETFKPSHKTADMIVMFADSTKNTYQNNIYSRDVIIAPKLFCDETDSSIYNKLLLEINAINNTEIWKLWHGDTHFIADDHIEWKNKCPTFLMIIDKLSKYFNMDVKASRLNWYRDLKEWKPFHHDAAAVDPKKAKNQNFTVGVSFGATRDIAFEHAETKTVSTFPLPNGMTYGFAKDVNIIWRHGIPQLSDKAIENFKGDPGRISIIIWGYSNVIDV
jgi:hypothetical protein